MQDGDAALASVSAEEEEAIPASIVARLLSGYEHPLKIWREYRGYSQESLGRGAPCHASDQMALLTCSEGALISPFTSST